MDVSLLAHLLSPPAKSWLLYCNALGADRRKLKLRVSECARGATESWLIMLITIASNCRRRAIVMGVLHASSEGSSTAHTPSNDSTASVNARTAGPSHKIAPRFDP